MGLNECVETSNATQTDVEACQIHKMQIQEPVNTPGQAAGHTVQKILQSEEFWIEYILETFIQIHLCSQYLKF